MEKKTAARCGPPLLLSEGLFCAFGWLIADGYYFEKPACPLFRLWTQEPIDLVEQQVVTPFLINMDEC